MSNIPLPAVSLIDDRPATTSLAIAEHFDKRHCDVLRDIQNLITNCPKEFTERNFALSEYIDSTGRKLPMYYIFFDGFILLVMGYTGKKALAMKLAYIAAFNAMREKLEAAKNQSLPSRKSPELTQTHIATLHATIDGIVKKAGLTSSESIRLAHLRIWNKFKTRFGISKYAELPQKKLNDAISFLMQLELPVESKALPGGLSAPCPFSKREREQAKMELDKLVRQLNKIFSQLRDGMRPGPANMQTFEANHKFFTMRQHLACMASREVYAARQTLELAKDMLED